MTAPHRSSPLYSVYAPYVACLCSGKVFLGHLIPQPETYCCHSYYRCHFIIIFFLVTSLRLARKLLCVRREVQFSPSETQLSAITTSFTVMQPQHGQASEHLFV